MTTPPSDGEVSDGSRSLGARRADALTEIAAAYEHLELDQPGIGSTTQVQLNLTPQTHGTSRISDPLVEAATPPFPDLTVDDTDPSGTTGAAMVLGRGVLDGTGLISTPETQLMACYAGAVLPTLTDMRGRLIAGGHPQRLFTGRIRQQLAARDRGCAFPDCDVPPALCDGHHIVPWHQGGPRTLNNAVMQCRHHHRIVEPDPAVPDGQQWQVRLDSRGRPEVIPPTWIDSTRQPRQHQRYRE